MRIFCFIFSLYTLTLALTPCADGFCGGDNEHQLSVEHQDEKAEDLCSSFCICACCGYSAAEFIATTKLALAGHYSSNPESHYKPPHIPYFSIDFWQPPRIG